MRERQRQQYRRRHYETERIQPQSQPHEASGGSARGKGRLLVHGGGKEGLREGGGGEEKGRKGGRGWCLCMFSLPLCVY